MRYLISSTLAWAVLAAALAAGAGAAEPAAQGEIRVLLTFGGHGFEQRPFFAMFDAMPGVKYTKAPLPQSALSG